MSLRHHLIAAGLCGLVFRLAMVGLVGYRFDVGDAATYITLAQNLADRGVYSLDVAPPFRPTAFRPPLFPAMVALVYSLGGRAPIAVQAAQVLLSTTTVLILGMAAARVNPRTAPLVLWAAMLCPFDAVYAGALISEVLCTLFVIGGLCIPLLWRHPARFFAAGLAFGAAALTRDVFLLLAPAAGAALILVRQLPTPDQASSRGGRVARAAALCLGALVCIVPWTIRNRIVLCKFIPVTRGALGLNLWIGTWETTPRWFDHGFDGTLPPEATRSGKEREVAEDAFGNLEATGDEALLRVAISRLIEEPARVLARWVRRFPYLWIGTRFEIFNFRPALLERGRPLWYFAKASLFGLNALVLLLGTIGLLRTLRVGGGMSWLAIPLVYTVFAYVPFHNTEPRYSQPVYPLLIAMAVNGAGAWRQRWRSLPGGGDGTASRAP